MGIGEGPSIGEVVIGSESLNIAGRCVHLRVCVVGHPDLAFAGALRRNENYTVRSPRTIDSCGGGILENVNRLHLVGRNIAEGSLHSVDENERLITLGNGTAAAHAYVHGSIGTAVLADNVHTRQLALQGLSHVGHRDIGNILGGNRRHRSREVPAPYGLITDDHHVIEIEGIFLEYKVIDALPLIYGGFCAGITYTGYNNGGICGGGEGIVSIYSGRRAGQGTFNHNCSTHYGIPFRVSHRTGNLLLRIKATPSPTRAEENGSGQNGCLADQVFHHDVKNWFKKCGCLFSANIGK